MLAPKAAKSDKGQIDSDRAPNGSSSDFSEDDTPLAVRLNTQGTSRPNDTGKPRIRPFLSKKGASFVIPRKKKQTNGNAYWDLLLICYVDHFQTRLIFHVLPVQISSYHFILFLANQNFSRFQILTREMEKSCFEMWSSRTEIQLWERRSSLKNLSSYITINCPQR